MCSWRRRVREPVVSTADQIAAAAASHLSLLVTDSATVALYWIVISQAS